MLKGIQTRSDTYRDWCERVEQVLEGVGIDKTGMAPPGNHIHVHVCMCVALPCCLFDLASFFLPSHLSLKCVYTIYMYNVHVHKTSHVLCTSV